jgi:hypothetical protein
MHESLPNKSKGLNLIASIILHLHTAHMYVSDKLVKAIALNLQISHIMRCYFGYVQVHVKSRNC